MGVLAHGRSDQVPGTMTFRRPTSDIFLAKNIFKSGKSEEVRSLFYDIYLSFAFRGS
jgi:hypothetical protein